MSCPTRRGASSRVASSAVFRHWPTATLRELGYQRAVALDGGVKAWREAGYPLKSGSEP